MRVLALDTTTRAGSVALVVDDVVVDERAGDASRTHGERLPAELAQFGTPWDSVDVFAVAVGPGSFTGLRIGIATIQGLAFATGRRIGAVSALEALAQIASERLAPGALIGAWVDAQRGEVFAALYQVTGAALFTPERIVELEPPTVAVPDAMRESWSRHDLSTAIFTGDGATRYLRAPAPPLLAGAIGRMATVQASRGQTVSPAGVHPLYVRRPDAELARLRQGSGEAGR